MVAPPRTAVVYAIPIAAIPVYIAYFRAFASDGKTIYVVLEDPKENPKK